MLSSRTLLRRPAAAAAATIILEMYWTAFRFKQKMMDEHNHHVQYLAPCTILQVVNSARHFNVIPSFKFKNFLSGINQINLHFK